MCFGSEGCCIAALTWTVFLAVVCLDDYTSQRLRRQSRGGGGGGGLRGFEKRELQVSASSRGYFLFCFSAPDPDTSGRREKWGH